MEKAAAKEKSMLAESTKMMQLEARVANLEEESKVLYALKNELADSNSDLKKNNVLLTNTYSELVQQVEKLEKRPEDNLGVLEKLRSATEKDVQTITEQEKMIHTLGQDLKEQKTFVVEAERALKEKFVEIYEVYKTALAKFGAEPLLFLGDESVKEIFDWVEEEFKGLPEVITGSSNFAASFCLDSAFQLLEKNSYSHFLTLAARTYMFPSASELDEEEKSKNLRATKINFFKQLWATSGREYTRLVAQERLAQVRVHITLYFIRFAFFLLIS